MMEIVNYEGWPDCIRLFNNETELIITTAVGPRIIRAGFTSERNLLYVSDADKGKTGGAGWRIYGGHRLWHAPEVMPRTYYPDNFPVGHKWENGTLRLLQPVESTTGIIKEMEISLDKISNHIHIVHRLINTNLWTIETSPWAITAHTGGTRAILPQEPYADPADNLLPARPVVLWNYTLMADNRWTWGDRYIQLQHDPSLRSEQKIGILNKQGWTAALLGDTLMLKRFGFDPNSVYPDYNSNNEVYVNEQLLEIETLGPVARILPGESVEHTEDWYLTRLHHQTDIVSDTDVDKYVLPIIKSLIT